MHPIEYIESNWTPDAGCSFKAVDLRGKTYDCVVFPNHKWDIWAYRGTVLKLRGMASDPAMEELRTI